MAVALSSLMDLFRGEDDTDPVYQPELVVLIANGLAEFPATEYRLAEAIYPDLAQVPRTFERYADHIGVEAMNAIRAGFGLWKQKRAEPAKAA